MKELKKEAIFTILILIFTLSSFSSIFTEFYHDDQFGYSFLLVTLPIKYESLINTNTKIFFYETCNLQTNSCPISSLLFHMFLLCTFILFYSTLLFFKKYSLYTGILYLTQNTFLFFFSLLNSEKYTFGLFLSLINGVQAAILIAMIRRKINIEKNIVEYDIVHNSSNSIQSGSGTARNNDSGNDSRVEMSSLMEKFEANKQKYKALKKKDDEKQRTIHELRRELREKDNNCKELQKEVYILSGCLEKKKKKSAEEEKEKERDDSGDRNDKWKESNNLEYEVIDDA